MRRASVLGSSWPQATLASRTSSALLVSAAVSLILRDAAHAQERQPTSPPSSVEAATRAPASLDEVIVVGRRVFRAEIDTTATGLDMSIQETPLSVTVLTKDLIELTNINSLADATTYIAGVNSRGSYAGSYSFDTARGFDLDLNSNYLVNGERYLRLFDIDVALLDRVEFLKGPASLMYGYGSFGGVFNSVTKRPYGEADAALTAEVGSFNTYRGEADVNVPLSQSGKLATRFGAVFDSRDSHIDFRDSERVGVSGSLLGVLGERTELLLTGIYQRTDGVPSDHASLGLDSQVPDIPRDRYLGQPWNDDKTEVFFAQAELVHGFSDDLRLEVSANYAQVLFDFQEGYIYGRFDDDGNVGMYDFPRSQDNDDIGIQAALGGKWDMFGRTHEFLLSADASQRDFKGAFYFSTFVGTFNVFNPRYDFPEPDLTDRGGTFVDDDERSVAGVAQVLLRPLDRVSILAGGRYEKYDFDRQYTNDPSRNYANEESVFIPRFGVTYELTGDTNVYASYTESFLSNFGVTDANRNNLDPQTGEQYEIGVKSELFGGGVLATLSLFEVTQSNIARLVEQPDIYAATGERRSRGAEIEAVGEVTEGLDLIFAYTYIDAEVTEDADPARIGLRPTQTPKHEVAVFANYQFPSGPLAGWGFGAGVNWVGERFAGDALSGVAADENSVLQDDYLKLDLVVSYTGIPRWDIQARVSNVLDEEWEIYSYDTLLYGVQFNEPRAYLLRATYAF